MNIEIYTEYTPNPESLKFVANVMLLPNNTVDFKTKEDADCSPLALELFEKTFVQGVFLANNFVTITKSPGVEWIEVIPEIKDYLKAYIVDKKTVVDEEKLKAFLSKSASQKGNTELEDKIISLLDQYVKPAVEMDGGAIKFKSFEEEKGVVTLLLQGSCSGCPSSTITLKNGIEGLLTRMMPEVKEVVAEMDELTV